MNIPVARLVHIFDYFKKRFCGKYEEEETASINRIKEEKPDRLSSLPDDLIVRILSLLTAKEIAETCILSKKWLNLWALVPSLSFDFCDFNRDINRFENFVSNFLLERNGTIDTHSFRILYDGLQPVYYLGGPIFSKGGEWINYAVKLNTKILELSFERWYHLNIPDCFFTSKTLEDVKLNLRGCVMQEIPNVVSLPRLKNLNMTEIKFCDDSLEKIIAGCPILEDLIMKNCILDLSSFSCHSVKKLQLLDLEIYSETISISVPCVQTLLFSWDVHVDCKVTLENTAKVARATWWNGPIIFEEEYMYDLLRSLSGVEELDIPSIRVPKLLKCPKFENLKFLTIRYLYVSREFGAWTSFFKYCPHLEELHFVHPDDLNCWLDGECKQENLIQFERCSCKYLKTVGIFYDKLQYGVLQLHSLVEQWTKEMKDVTIFLEEQV